MSPDKTSVTGMVVLRSEVNFLFSLIQSWPLQSETAESLLAAKDGSDVVFLNQLRHRKGSALRLRIPLSSDHNTPAWPAISSTTGHYGLFEANDYRGMRVLAYTLAVPDTSWGMVVKMDIAEAVAHGKKLQQVTLSLALFLIAFVGFFTWQWWRRDAVEKLANEQLRQAQHRLLQSENMLNEAQQLAHLGGWERNLVTNSLNCSSEIFRILEIDSAHSYFSYENYISTVHPEDRETLDHVYVTSIRTREPFDLEHRRQFADGRVKWVNERGAFYYDDQGVPLRSTGTLQDITERKHSEQAMQRSEIKFRTVRKRAEETLRKSNDELEAINHQLRDAQNLLLQSDKMASVGQLAAGVAHEINNPIGYVGSNLGSLDGYLQQLFEMLAAYEVMENAVVDSVALARVRALKNKGDLEFLKEDVPSLMRESQEGIVRVKKIVQDLKDFSRVDSSDQWNFANLHQGLDSTLNVASNEIKYKADVKKEYGDLPEVECLPSQLNQVFMNLLVNAAHAIEERGTITLRSGRQGEEVWVEVADNGKGIAPEHLNRIFEPFFTTKPVGQGTGLGLSLSFGIIQGV